MPAPHWWMLSKRSSCAQRRETQIRDGCGQCGYPAQQRRLRADGVVHALLDEAVFGCARELFLSRRLRIACCFGISFAFRQKALLGCANSYRPIETYRRARIAKASTPQSVTKPETARCLGAAADPHGTEGRTPSGPSTGNVQAAFLLAFIQDDPCVHSSSEPGARRSVNPLSAGETNIWQHRRDVGSTPNASSNRSSSSAARGGRRSTQESFDIDVTAGARAGAAAGRLETDSPVADHLHDTPAVERRQCMLATIMVDHANENFIRARFGGSFFQDGPRS